MGGSRHVGAPNVQTGKRSSTKRVEKHIFVYFCEKPLNIPSNNCVDMEGIALSNLEMFGFVAFFLDPRLVT